MKNSFFLVPCAALFVSACGGGGSGTQVPTRLQPGIAHIEAGFGSSLLNVDESTIASVPLAIAPGSADFKGIAILPVSDVRLLAGDTVFTVDFGANAVNGTADNFATYNDAPISGPAQEIDVYNGTLVIDNGSVEAFGVDTLFGADMTGTLTGSRGDVDVDTNFAAIVARSTVTGKLLATGIIQGTVNGPDGFKILDLDIDTEGVIVATE